MPDPAPAMSAPPEAARPRDRVLAIALAAGALALYAATLCPTVFWYDSAEYVTAAVVLGIPHPPGYPLYTLLGHVFTWLPLSPAVAVNLMSAVFAAVAVGLCYAVGRALGAGRVAALVGAGMLGLSRLFWSQALIAEVYTPAIAFLLAVLLLVLRGLDQDRGGLLVAAAGLAGLGLGVHLSIATCGLGLGLLVWGLGLEVDRPRQLRALLGRAGLGRRLRIAAGALGATALGSLIFLYLPLRASMRPALNYGDPSAWERFVWHITGGNYKHWFDDAVPASARAAEIAGLLHAQLGTVGLGLAVIGAAHLLRRAAHRGLGLVLMIAGNVGFFLDYQVHDREVFFLPSAALLCCLAGVGAHALIAWVDRRPARAVPLGRLARVAACALPLSLLASNLAAVDMRGYRAAEVFGETLAEELPEGAVIAYYATPPEWQVNAVFGLYFQEVLGRRRDVQVRASVSADEMRALLAQGVPLYVYVPLRPVVATFEVVQEGALFRVVAPHGPPAPAGGGP